MTNPSETPSASSTYRGGCHCGGLQIEVDLSLASPPSPFHAPSRCNCTFCRKRGAVTMLVHPSAFRVLAGDTEARYAPKGDTGHYAFCGTCGMHVFARGHLEQLGGDFVTVNLDTLEDFPRDQVTVAVLDGRNDTWAFLGTGPLLG